MKNYELFSKRQKRIRGEVPDVYQHETIPEELRIQVIHIWKDEYGEIECNYYNISDEYAYEAYAFIHNKLCREYGMISLGEEEDLFQRVCNFFLDTKETEKVIDVIEFSFRCFDPEVSDNNKHFCSNVPPDQAIDELNNRFREHGVGYQYESGQIIKVDSQFIHTEVVKPVLTFLSDPMYEGAKEEFLNAHQHYRKHRYKECMNECLKAFESCLKGICKKRGWHYDENRATAKDLIEIVFDNELIPTYLESHFSALKKTLKNTLKDGLPTVRNRESGHGQGPEITTVPEYLAAYALHLTASNILLLTKADAELK